MGKSHIADASTPPRSNDAVEIREASRDPGAPILVLRKLGRGICVERQLLVQGRREYTAYASFADESSFNRWCDADAAIVGRPNFHLRLKRAAEEAFRHCAVVAKGRESHET